MKREEARKRAEELVSGMTLEEKASQLRFDAPAIPRLGIPAYNWWNEALHGVARAGTATVFPQAIGMAATWDEDLLEEIGKAVSLEARAKFNAARAQGDRDIYKGITLWAPNVNIFRDPRWGRGQETYGEDPYLTSRLGVRYVRGLQGTPEEVEEGTMRAAACAKHFAVHSGPERIRHEFNAEVSRKDLAETYLPAFRALVQEGKTEGVMGAYNRLYGEPCCGSKKLLTDLLRTKWGFDGYVTSDCWAVQDFHQSHHVTKTPEESAVLALEAGCDINCGCTYQSLLSAYRQGMLREEFLTKSCVRAFTTRYLLGIMPGQSSEYDSVPLTEVDSSQNRRLAKRTAEEGIVLLKNDGVLPLDPKSVHTLAIIGPNADSRHALDGNYHGTASRYETVSEGIQDYVRDHGLEEKIRILYAQGCSLVTPSEEPLARKDDRLSEARAAAELADTIVLAVGLNEFLEGEEMDQSNGVGSGDKDDLLLPGPQRRLLQAIADVTDGTKKRVILCLMAGSDIDLSFAEAHFGAVLDLWYPGEEGGAALADILFGEVSPSGKLPVTFYQDLEGLPAFTDYSMAGRTYKYTKRPAQYPFGFGLTYGDVAVTGVRALDPEGEKTETFGVGKDLILQVDTENRGEKTGDVIEVYLRITDAADQKDLNWSLVGFRKAFWEAGERKTLRIPIPAASFLTVNEEGERVPEGTVAELHVGTSQPDAVSIRKAGKCPVCLALRRDRTS